MVLATGLTGGAYLYLASTMKLLFEGPARLLHCLPSEEKAVFQMH
jgi:hypothetical protein